ncbi:hypothetical protein AM1BK_33190 [Neobacillus kokaensis]|uniref:Uncharacterized protein n=1 Tax=Neobacillus kokaensis TaxID=2759023 RepID=A0ABQ3NAN0_9BACI|nr:hypothetical protein AM1BK_33190 [Neobacillus kokaensis]
MYRRNSLLITCEDKMKIGCNGYIFGLIPANDINQFYITQPHKKEAHLKRNMMILFNLPQRKLRIPLICIWMLKMKSEKFKEKVPATRLNFEWCPAHF